MVPERANLKPDDLLPPLRDVLENHRLEIENGCPVEDLTAWFKNEQPNFDITAYGFQEFIEFLNYAQDKTVVRLEPHEDQGMLAYLGPKGWLSQFLQLAHLYDGPIRLTHNYWGVLISLVISGFPFAFLLILSYVTGIDPVLARAAATLGAGPWSQFRHIYLPLLLPGLAMCFCLAFVQAFSVFPSAVLVGAPAGPTRVISIAAYEAAFELYDYSLASAVAMIMGLVQLAIVALVLGARSLVYRGPVTGGKG